MPRTQRMGGHIVEDQGAACAQFRHQRVAIAVHRTQPTLKIFEPSARVGLYAAEAAVHAERRETAAIRAEAIGEHLRRRIENGLCVGEAAQPVEKGELERLSCEQLLAAQLFRSRHSSPNDHHPQRFPPAGVAPTEPSWEPTNRSAFATSAASGRNENAPFARLFHRRDEEGPPPRTEAAPFDLQRADQNSAVSLAPQVRGRLKIAVASEPKSVAKL